MLWTFFKLTSSWCFRCLWALSKNWHHRCSRTGILYVIYKKEDKKYITKYRPIPLLNLNYQIYTTILQNCIQKTSVTIITEKQSAAIKNKTILHTLSIICGVVDVSNKLNKNLSVISSKSLVEWIRILSFLYCKSLDLEKNSFVWLKLNTPTFNLKLK